jgi:hypothetical protein
MSESRNDVCLANQAFLAGQTVDAGQVAAWVETFHRDGYLFLQDVLPPAMVTQLKSDLNQALTEHRDLSGAEIELRARMFEISAANVRLFDLDPIASFAEALIAPDCHVVHNNSFQTLPARVSQHGIRTMRLTSW